MERTPQEDGSRTWLADYPGPGAYSGWGCYANGLADILTYLGEPTTPTDLLAFGGDAFHLCFPSIEEADPARLSPVDPAGQMAAAFGFAGHWLHHGHELELIQHLDGTEKRCLMDAIFEQIAAEIDAGRPVLMQGGIDEQETTAFVVTGYDRQRQELCSPDIDGGPTWTKLCAGQASPPGYWQGVVRGAVRPGFYGGRLVNPIFCLGRPPPPPGERDRLQQALERAVALHLAAPIAFQAPRPFTCSFGDLAYQRWAQAIGAEASAPSAGQTVTTHPFLLDTVTSGRRAAAVFCRHAAEILIDAGAELVAAADAYDKEAALATESFGNDSAPDADTVQQLHQFERAAIDNLQGALRTLAGIEQDGARVWIRHVPNLEPQEGKDCFFAGALEAALAVTEYPVNYRDIMCCSGLATRVNWYIGASPGAPRWDRSCAIGERPSSHQPLQQATGWRFQPIIRRGWPDMTEFVPLVIDAIDAGRPTPCYIRHPRMGVVFGYENQGETLLCRSYDAPGETIELPSEELGWLIYLVDHHTDPPAPDDSFLETLRLILRQWHSPAEVTPGGKLLSGAAAYRRWAADLQAADELDAATRELLFSVNWFVFHEIADARQQIAPFLRDNGTSLPPDAGDKLELAAQAYDQVTEWARSAYEMHDAFLGPWTDKTIDDWTPAVRENEILLLHDMLGAESAAVEHLESVLAAGRRVDWAPDELQLLEQWSNLFGKATDCIRAADRDPVFFELLREQLGMPETPMFVANMRQSMTQLDPTDQNYGDQIDILTASLAAGQFVQPWPDGATASRRHRVKQLAQAMELWLTGKSQADAKRTGAGESAVDEVYRLLGKFDASKKRPVAMTIQKLRTGALPKDLKELQDDSPSAPLAAQLAHNIAGLEIQRWTFEHNLKVLLNSIGEKRVIAPWGAADGPIPWRGIQALNPRVKPRLQEAIDDLRAWLESANESTSQFGDPDDYPGKVWLARCLLAYLEHHIAGQF